MIELSRDIPMFRAIVDRFVQGEPAALLLTEFAGIPRRQFAAPQSAGRADGRSRRSRRCRRGDRAGLPAAVWEIRAQGLNIMMSMKGDGKPVSFLEDARCASKPRRVYRRLTGSSKSRHLRHLVRARLGRLPACAAGAQRQTGARGQEDAGDRRGSVRDGPRIQGSHSGEHGDGWCAPSSTRRCSAGAWCVLRGGQGCLRPGGLFNPGKIVRAPKMDDRSLFRFKPDYHQIPIATALDWSEWGGFAAAAEMCNKTALAAPRRRVMCPSFRATSDEQHLTRGRANTCGWPVGPARADALVSDHMRETMALCISCKVASANARPASTWRA